MTDINVTMEMMDEMFERSKEPMRLARNAKAVSYEIRQMLWSAILYAEYGENVKACTTPPEDVYEFFEKANRSEQIMRLCERDIELRLWKLTDARIDNVNFGKASIAQNLPPSIVERSRHLEFAKRRDKLLKATAYIRGSKGVRNQFIAHLPNDHPHCWMGMPTLNTMITRVLSVWDYLNDREVAIEAALGDRGFDFRTLALEKLAIENPAAQRL